MQNPVTYWPPPTIRRAILAKAHHIPGRRRLNDVPEAGRVYFLSMDISRLRDGLTPEQWKSKGFRELVASLTGEPKFVPGPWRERLGVGADPPVGPPCQNHLIRLMARSDRFGVSVRSQNNSPSGIKRGANPNS